MSQNDMIIADADGATVLADMSSAFQALASTSKGPTAPGTPYAGQLWLDDNTPSATVWALSCYDGSDWIKLGELDTNNNVFTPLVAGVTPGGRLTLVSGTPVLTGDAAGNTTIYYTPHVSATIPIYNGTDLILTTFPEVSLALDSNSGHTGYHQSGKLFDLFVVNLGSCSLVTGPAWSSSTARGTGAGTTELQKIKGIWTNKNLMTVRFGSASGNTVAVAANQATYVGTFYAVADGQVTMQFKPAAASGGANSMLGLYNAYHRVLTRSQSKDSTASWAYTTVAWRSANNNNNNRISFVDGLQQSHLAARYACGVGASATSVSGGISLNLDGTSNGATGANCSSANSGSPLSFLVSDTFAPQLGFHFVQATELGATTVTFYASGNTQLLELELEM